ncbi:hypothetical protein [Caproiciproducens sp. CPB-2]|uniref:hypothetical protein n=1 Tax=Caproiciproducens sp. CPB-2 TaxID=3030017 RepID=UPI002E351B76|nr:hypothetical protein [Caproiciproducens sp. CPB-2]
MLRPIFSVMIRDSRTARKMTARMLPFAAEDCAARLADTLRPLSVFSLIRALVSEKILLESGVACLLRIF